MTKDFDPYHRWLGIPPEQQPADLYRLLGLAQFEDDVEVVRDAAERYIRHVRDYQAGEHREAAKQILNELAHAKAVLLDPQKRAEYNRGLPQPVTTRKPDARGKSPAAAPRKPKHPVAQRLPSTPEAATLPPLAPLPPTAPTPTAPTPAAPTPTAPPPPQPQPPRSTAPPPPADDDGNLNSFLDQLDHHQDAPSHEEASHRPPAAPDHHKPAKHPPAGRGAAPWVMVAAGGVLTLIVLMVVLIALFQRSKYGTLAVEGPPDGFQIAIKQGGKIVQLIADGDHRQIDLKAGQYEVELTTGQDQYEIHTDTVTVLRGDTTTLEVCETAPQFEPRTGLIARLFDNQDLIREVKTRVDSEINFYWGDESPDPALPADHFTITWTGWLKAPLAGRYRFKIRADDKWRFWLDNKLLVDSELDNWQTDVELDRSPHEVKIEFVEHSKTANIFLTWILLGGSTEHVVPAGVFFQDRESAQAATVDASVLVKRRATAPPSPRPGESVDLLALADPATQTVGGRWWFDGDVLMCDWGRPSLLQIPFTPPAEYEITMEVQRVRNHDYLLMGLVAGGHQFGVAVDGGGSGNSAGVEALDGTLAYDSKNETRKLEQLVSTERPVTLKYTVRRSKLTVTCDDRTVLEWDADYRRCSMRDIWTVPGQRYLFLGTWETYLRISKLKLTPLTAAPQVFPDDVPQGPRLAAGGRDLRVGESMDLVPYVDVARDYVRGRWSCTGEGVTVGSGHTSRLMLPVFLNGDYELDVEFTRRAGAERVAFALPVGTRHLHFELGRDKAAGFLGIDGCEDIHGETGVRPGTISNNRRYRLQAAVQMKDDQVAVDVKLDGQPYTRWVGKQSSLFVPHEWSHPALNRPGLAAHWANVSFHTARVRLTKGSGYLLDANHEDREPYRMTPEFGGGGGDRFHAFASNSSFLVGLRCTAGRVIYSIQPVFLNGDMLQVGQVYGTPRGERFDLTAKDGYAIGGLRLNTGSLVDGIQAVFMRIDGDKLDPRDSYESSWAGPAAEDFVVGLTGERSIGIYGATGSALDSLGLILPRAHDTAEPAAPSADIPLTALRPLSATVGHDVVRVKKSASDTWASRHHQPLVPRNARYCEEFLFAHAKSIIPYAVPRGARSFTAVGYCPRSRSVSYQIVVDDKSLFQSPPAGVVQVRVDIPPGSETIELIVDDLGDYGSDQSYWLFPRFHRDADAQTAQLDGAGDHEKCTALHPTSFQVGWGTLLVNQWAANVRPVHVVEEEVCDEFIFAHAPSRLSYALPAGVKEFSAVGYNLASATTRFRVFVDGRPLFTSPVAGIVPIRVPIPAGAKRLDLIVDQGTSNNSDWSYWCYPRLHRAGGSR